MARAYEDAERKIVAALLLEWYAPSDRLIDAGDLYITYGVTVDKKLFDAIVANLQQRGIVLACSDKDGSSAILLPEGYKEAQSVVTRELGDPETFSVNWKNEEIISEAAAPDWFPIPEGWKWFKLAPKVARPALPKRRVPRNRESVNWEKWGVIVAAIGVAIAGAALLHH